MAIIKANESDRDHTQGGTDFPLTHVNEKHEYNDATDDDNLKPDDVITHLGGCGVFQWLLGFLIQFMKIVVCWGMATNSFFAYVPRWRCIEFEGNTDIANSLNKSTNSYSPQLANMTSSVINITSFSSMNQSADSEPVEEYWNQKCELGSSPCVKFEYENTIHSWVSEFNLVCEQSWVTATIISLQMVGMMLGSIVVGHLADLFGRKKPFVFSMAILGVFNLMCYFARSWMVIAAGRFFIGIASAFFLSIYCILQGEFTLSKWRSTAIGFPSWPIELCVFVLVAWLIPNWKYLMLMIALGSFGFLLSWFFIPESFRWYIANNHIKQAKSMLNKVAKWNKRTLDEEFFQAVCKTIERQETESKAEKYSLIVLFRKLSLLKLTLPMTLCWLTLGIIAYGISFGIKKLSGNYFLNLFLFALASIPSKMIALYLQIRCGRKITAVIAYGICVIGGLVVGIVQYIETDYRGALTNYFALAASAGVDMAWGPMQTLAVELYPTVARNTAFGFLSTLARFGAVIGPQFVFLEEYLPGLLYFIIAVMSFISIVLVLLLPETMNTTLLDKITDDLNKERRQEMLTAPDNVKA